MGKVGLCAVWEGGAVCCVGRWGCVLCGKVGLCAVWEGGAVCYVGRWGCVLCGKVGLCAVREGGLCAVWEGGAVLCGKVGLCAVWEGGAVLCGKVGLCAVWEGGAVCCVGSRTQHKGVISISAISHQDRLAIFLIQLSLYLLPTPFASPPPHTQMTTYPLHGHKALLLTLPKRSAYNVTPAAHMSTAHPL